jgi:serine/threonine protein kinase
VEEADGQACIVMEYVEGQPLSRLIPENGFAAEIVLRYGVEIADAVAHAHEHGVVHRDLKSGNIVVTEEGRIKLLDFGLSRFLPETQVPGPVLRLKSSSGSRSAAGTLDYVAPEVLRGEVPDHRSDIWSLGVLAYETATGKMPFQGRTDFELASAILRDPPAALPQRVPLGLRAIILRGLAKDPSQRYQRCGELRAALQAVQSQLTKKPAPWVLQRWLGAIAAGLLLLLVSVVLYFWLVPPPIDSVASAQRIILPETRVSGFPFALHRNMLFTQERTSDKEAVCHTTYIRLPIRARAGKRWSSTPKIGWRRSSQRSKNWEAKLRVPGLRSGNTT